mgnify:FL=1
MKMVLHKSIFLFCLFFCIPFFAWSDDRPAIEGDLTIYMQMGGNSGGPATLARELGARDAARILDVNLIEQHSEWNPQRMLQQANEALAAVPDAIIVMGHPGTKSMTTFSNILMKI